MRNRFPDSRADMKILIVDDSIHVQRQLKAFLVSGGYREVIFADSAVQALSFLGFMEQPFVAAEIDLILMDIQMDGIDGIEATRTIKAKSAYKDVPVLMISGEESEKSLENAFAAGAVDYITKPLRKLELLSRVGSFLMLRQEIIKRKKREQELINLAAELRKANSILSRIAELDGLTGIANRRYFDQLLRREWQRALRNGSSLSLLMIDIDHFKLYNDNYGHLEGDRCLKEIAQTMSSALRRPGDVLARYGGEEFAAILPETDSEGARHIAEAIAASIVKLARPHAFSPVSALVTISTGIAAIIPDKNNNKPNSLIHMADKALYFAKSQGRNRICVGQNEIDHRSFQHSPTG